MVIKIRTVVVSGVGVGIDWEGARELSEVLEVFNPNRDLSYMGK